MTQSGSAKTSNFFFFFKYRRSFYITLSYFFLISPLAFQGSIQDNSPTAAEGLLHRCSTRAGRLLNGRCQYDSLAGLVPPPSSQLCHLDSALWALRIKKKFTFKTIWNCPPLTEWIRPRTLLTYLGDGRRSWRFVLRRQDLVKVPHRPGARRAENLGPPCSTTRLLQRRRRLN